MRRAEVVTTSVVLAAVFGFVFVAAVSPLAGAISVVVVVALGLTLSWFVRRRFRAWRYQERNEDLIVARGVMVQRVSVVPYGRMQFVEVTAGPIERLFQRPATPASPGWSRPRRRACGTGSPSWASRWRRVCERGRP